MGRRLGRGLEPDHGPSPARQANWGMADAVNHSANGCFSRHSRCLLPLPGRSAAAPGLLHLPPALSALPSLWGAESP